MAMGVAKVRVHLDAHEVLWYTVSMKQLTHAIKAQALALGFDVVGVAPCTTPPHAENLPSWVDAGYAGEMAYLTRNVPGRMDPRHIMPEGRSILVVGKHYRVAEPLEHLWHNPSRGRIARYAWGPDYHDIVLPRLRQIVDFVATHVGRSIVARPYVDTGPVLERPVATLALPSFIGKHTLLILPRHGSWLFLAEILLDVELEPDDVTTHGRCGTCARCLQVCPTQAFVAPYVLDARRCISYLTIELKGAIPHDMRPLLGNWIFGCDACQEVCPWNRRFGAVGDADMLATRADTIAPPLIDLMELDDAAFRERFRGSPIKRSKRRGLLRNVVIALGNWGDPQAVPALCKGLHDAEPLIRGHAAWALGRIDDSHARNALRACWTAEDDAWVRAEIAQAIEGVG